jgi:hypothetical protein
MGQKSEMSDPAQHLHAIKDWAISLRLAGEYLCEEALLQKIGLQMGESLDRLREEIALLKKQFVGKPAHDMSVDKELEGVATLAKLLQKPDKGVSNRCREGGLGQNLWDKTRSLMEVVDVLKGRIEGKRGSKRKDYLLGVQDGVNSALDRTTDFVSILGKLALNAFVILIVAFSILFVTLEGEKEFTDKIELKRGEILERHVALSRVKDEMTEAREELFRMATVEELSRMDKLNVLSMSITIYRLEEEKVRLELGIRNDEEKIGEVEKELLKMKRKSFLSRLLRQ